MSFLQQILAKGGAVMVPLLACSIAALAVFLERAVYLRRGHVLPGSLRRFLRDLAAGGESRDHPAPPQRALSSPLGRVVAGLLTDDRGGGRNRAGERERAVENLEVEARQAGARLERGLVILEIIVGISPLLGLLGTVLGLVHVFRDMSLQGDADILSFSRGIAEALWTTVAGLAIAIPALVAHRYFQRRVELLLLEMEHLAWGAVQRLYPPER